MTDGAVDFDAMHRQRMEKDLTELQTLINRHFEQRKIDDEDLENLKRRIGSRREKRQEEIRIRQQREKERIQKEKEERARREAEEEQRKIDDEARKKAAISNMSQHYGGYLARNDRQKGNRRQTEREKKRKLLAERRKPLNIDHLGTDKLKDKARDLGKWLAMLEEERYDFETVVDKQKYDVMSLRSRVNQYMNKSGKGGAGAKRQVKTLTSVKKFIK